MTRRLLVPVALVVAVVLGACAPSEPSTVGRSCRSELGSLPQSSGAQLVVCPAGTVELVLSLRTESVARYGVALVRDGVAVGEEDVDTVSTTAAVLDREVIDLGDGVRPVAYTSPGPGSATMRVRLLAPSPVEWGVIAGSIEREPVTVVSAVSS